MHTIELHGPVGGDTFHFSLLRDLPAGRLHVRINSGGGDPVHSYGTYHALRQHAEESGVVTTEIIRAASAAVLVALAGDVRVIHGDGSIFLHCCQAATIGDSRSMVAAARRMARQDRRYAQLAADRTGQPYQIIRDLCSAETTLSSSDALKLGFVHRIAGVPVEPTVDRGTAGERRLGTLSHIIRAMSPAWQHRRKQAAPVAMLAPGATDEPPAEPWPQSYRNDATESLERILEARRRRANTLCGLRGPASYSDFWPRPVNWSCHCGARNSHAPENEHGFSTACCTCGAFFSTTEEERHDE